MLKLFSRLKNKTVRAFRLSVLASGLFYKLKIIWFEFMPKGKRDHLFKFKKFGQIFGVWLCESDNLAIFEEVFLKDEYDITLNSEPSVIVDLGSNIGLSVMYFKLKYPNSIIHAVEPDPKTFALMSRNLAQFKGVHLWNLALSDRNGKEEFYVYPNQSMSSSLIKRLDSQESIEIQSATLDKFLNKFSQVDLLKFDVEGVEDRIFKNFNSWDKLKVVIGEVHLDLMRSSKEDFMDNFNSFENVISRLNENRYILRATKNE